MTHGTKKHNWQTFYIMAAATALQNTRKGKRSTAECWTEHEQELNRMSMIDLKCGASSQKQMCGSRATDLCCMRSTKTESLSAVECGAGNAPHIYISNLRAMPASSSVPRLNLIATHILKLSFSPSLKLEKPNLVLFFLSLSLSCNIQQKQDLLVFASAGKI